MMRTNTCGELSAQNIQEEVTLCGWVHRRRDHGGVIFVDLRDRYGLTQIVSDPINFAAAHKLFDEVRPEYVIQIKGKVRARPEGQSNPKMKTGEIEIVMEEIKILNRSKTPPFEIDQDGEVNEELRLKYRYLDLRRERMKNNIIMRHKVIKMIRDIFEKQDFIEVETPILIKGTPEGSREYLVPSRVHPGKFFVLPQSPQQLKQLLMVSGFDRYFQIARCFRDEDQRGDRQPEFTQLDIEMSFVDEEDIMALVESMLIKVTQELVPHKKLLFTPFKRISWYEAMHEYGSDKPDLRFEMKIKDISDIAENSGFEVFKKAVKNGGVVKALKVEGGLNFSRKEIDEFEEMAKRNGAKGLAYLQIAEDGPKSMLLKFLSEDEVKKIIERTEAKTGDIIFFGADSIKNACTSLGQVRLACADKLNLRNVNTFAYLWVYDFPLFEFDETANRTESTHHPFTTAQDQDKELVYTEPLKVRGKHYDIVLNGYEIGGGSIRIHEPELQSRVFDILGISREDAEKRFGHLLHAFEFGAPPHGGIALGMERLIMLFQDEPNIREVMAFPKDQKAKDLMMGAPTEMPADQVAEMHITINKQDE